MFEYVQHVQSSHDGHDGPEHPRASSAPGERPNCWSSISPAAECASTPSGVLELLEECKARMVQLCTISVS